MTTAKGKVAIVGGSSGIGLAAAQRLTTEGFNVVVSARTRERVETTVKTLGAGASGHVLDYGNRQSIAAFFKAMGRFNHLVLTAAGPEVHVCYSDWELLPQRVKVMVQELLKYLRGSPAF